MQKLVFRTATLSKQMMDVLLADGWTVLADDPHPSTVMPVTFGRTTFTKSEE